MKGLVIWAHSDCRSMMGLYRAIKAQLSCPIVMASWMRQDSNGCVSARRELGFSKEEFSDIKMIHVGEDWRKGCSLLDDHQGYNHLFGVYQKAPTFCRLIEEAHNRGDRVGILSESPCIMTSGLRGLAKKWIYLPMFVKRRIRGVIKASDFIANLSGDSSLGLRAIGWPMEKIVPFGYFPPPLTDSELRSRAPGGEFRILVTGAMTWHRGPDVVIRALALLKKWGVRCKAVFTQTGPLLSYLKRAAERNALDVSFVGLLPLGELTHLYETCSIFVAAGRSEPWGMRLNDALQCGLPIAVSRGMGGVKLVDEYGCGFSFAADDELDLASKLHVIITNPERYCDCANNAARAAKLISPGPKARELIDVVNMRFNDWFS